MKYFKFIFLSLFSTMLFSCSSLITSYKNKQINFDNYKKIAVTSFVSDSEYLNGQVLSDFITIEFMQKGYQVIERNQIKILVDEKILNTTGLTDIQKKNLKMSGIDAIITGTFQSKRSNVQQSIDIKEPLFEQNTVMSIKMLDSQTGEVLWLATGLSSEKNVNLNFQNIMRNFLNELKTQIPEINNKKWFWIF